MRILAIVQARMSSTRLPGKVLMKVNQQTILDILLHRLKKSHRISEIIIATTTNTADNLIERNTSMSNEKIFRGSESDVLGRYFNCATMWNADIIVRITADCPLVDHELVDEVIGEALRKDLDYYSNTLDETYPDGMDVEVFKYSALKDANQHAALEYQREHVTPFIKENSTFFGINRFQAENHSFPVDYSKVRLTIDRPEDLEVITQLIDKLGIEATWVDYADYYITNDMISNINSSIRRNEGLKKN
jgi:spore coat polysaccharide biosynthesis protein SpsF